MLFIFSTPLLIRHLWQLKRVLFLHWCLIWAILLIDDEHPSLYQAFPKQQGLIKATFTYLTILVDTLKFVAVYCVINKVFNRDLVANK